MNMVAAMILMLLPMITIMVCATDCNQYGKRTCNKSRNTNKYGRITKCQWASDKFKSYQSNADMPWVYGACFGPTDCVQSMCEWKIANYDAEMRSKGRFCPSSPHCIERTTLRTVFLEFY